MVARSPRLRFHGTLPNVDVLETMSAYDALLFPTKYEGEGFPGVLLEASYVGLYCVVTDHLYNKEVVDEYCWGTAYPNQEYVNQVANLDFNDIRTRSKQAKKAPLLSELVGKFDFV